MAARAGAPSEPGPGPSRGPPAPWRGTSTCDRRAQLPAVGGRLATQPKSPASARAPGGGGCVCVRPAGCRAGGWGARSGQRLVAQGGLPLRPASSRRLYSQRTLIDFFRRSGLRIKQWAEDDARLRWPRSQEPAGRLRALAGCAPVSAGPALPSPQPSGAQARGAPMERAGQAGRAKHPRD